MGLDSPSKSVLVARGGGHSMKTERVTGTDGRAVHRMTFSGKDDLSRGGGTGRKEDKGRQTAGLQCLPVRGVKG